MLSWQEEFQRLNNEKVSYKYSTFDVVQSILSAKDDERIRGLVLNLNDFEGGRSSIIRVCRKSDSKFQRVRKKPVGFALCLKRRTKTERTKVSTLVTVYAASYKTPKSN